MIRLLLLLSTTALAHDAPASVTVHLQMRGPDVLVRIPLEAVRDVDFPRTAGGYLDTAAIAGRLPDLARLWVLDKVSLQGTGRARVAAVNLAMESDRSFASFDQAMARLRGPLPRPEENLFWKQVWFDVHLAFPGAAESIVADFADLGERVSVVLHTPARTFLLEGSAGVVDLNPSWWQASGRFVAMGFTHILGGADHLLFLLCLVIPHRRIRPLVWIVSAFTLAHSVTLTGAALSLTPGGLWFPPLVEVTIAGSIVYMALRNILGATGHGAALAFAFGLVHGFGFSFALRESLQFAGDHVTAALVAFNLGVELGQVTALAVAVPVLQLLFRRGPERTLAIVLSALAAHTAWHWLVERWETLRRFDVSLTAADGALLLKWAVAGMAAWAVVWAGARSRHLWPGNGRSSQ